eukprot:scaffold33599_cov112-Isochrysis_galbana.AAC.3
MQAARCELAELVRSKLNKESPIAEIVRAAHNFRFLCILSCRLILSLVTFAQHYDADWVANALQTVDLEVASAWLLYGRQQVLACRRPGSWPKQRHSLLESVHERM